MNVPLFSAAAALAAAVAVSAAVYGRRYRRLHRVLARERAAQRLMDGRLRCDLDAFQARVEAAMARQGADRAVLYEAGLVVDEALALHAASSADLRDPNDPYDPFMEGGPV